MRWLALAALVAACSDDGATPRDAAPDDTDAELAPDSTVTSGAWGTPTLIPIPPPTDTDDGRIRKSSTSDPPKYHQ